MWRDPSSAGPTKWVKRASAPPRWVRRSRNIASTRCTHSPPDAIGSSRSSRRRCSPPSRRWPRGRGSRRRSGAPSHDSSSRRQTPAESEANRAAGTAAADKETDDLAFNAWFAAAVLGNAQAMEIAERRFRPEFKAAFDAWIKTDPLNNPDAPPSPTYMPEYVQPEIDEAEELDRHANELSKEGAERRDRRSVRAHHRVPRERAVPRRDQRPLPAAHCPLRADLHRRHHPRDLVALLVTSPWPPA